MEGSVVDHEEPSKYITASPVLGSITDPVTDIVVLSALTPAIVHSVGVS